MPHRKYEWLRRIKDTEREYRAVRIALDLLNEAPPDEVAHVQAERGWDALAPADAYAADRNLDSTYVIRMYSVFERAVGSFWRQLPGNTGREVSGDVMLDEVGLTRSIDVDVLGYAQEVRNHRNNLAHRRIEDHAGAMTIEAASRDLLRFLSCLPESWN